MFIIMLAKKWCSVDFYIYVLCIYKYIMLSCKTRITLDKFSEKVGIKFLLLINRRV